tara:strand:- start:69564 stop:70868 length:1305 start_codon:yes stop_codon:yes gene_type:complete
LISVEGLMDVDTAMTEQNLATYILSLGEQAKAASRIMAMASSEQKNLVLLTLAERIEAEAETLIAKNTLDLDAGKANGLDAALLDRLALNPARIAGMADGLRQVAGLADPVGQVSNSAMRPSGIEVGQMRVPLGVIGIIYESRPNVTADAAGLCLKSGNAAILRGGSEAIHSNQALGDLIKESLAAVGLPAAAVQVVATTDREAVRHLIQMQDYVSVIVPRGGKGLIERVSREATIPVIKHLDGNCHVYVDAEADLDKALAIAVNAKTHRFGVCNAMETLLLHEDIAATLLPNLQKAYKEFNVELRGCTLSQELVQGLTNAVEADWETEYLAPVLAIKVIQNLDQAIEHIEQYGSHHTDAIVTENYSTARHFIRAVDSSSVMVNASTRFADGYEYGLGAEIGISTDKLHARGPVGLEGLTTQKYVVYGSGNIRE